MVGSDGQFHPVFKGHVVGALYPAETLTREPDKNDASVQRVLGKRFLECAELDEYWLGKLLSSETIQTLCRQLNVDTSGTTRKEQFASKLVAEVCGFIRSWRPSLL